MVDTSEWLFATSFLRTLEFCEEYCVDDWENGRAEDSKLLDQIVDRAIDVPCTKRATLRYALGGYSNEWRHDGARVDDWLGWADVEAA
jgi:hypothetical protein